MIGLRSEEESTERRAVPENNFLSGSSECCNSSPDHGRWYRDSNGDSPSREPK